ncbi:hypothetical protein [Calidithermus chliarophilus]|uniref:hypothetical protein n=1 Tax=Calidithermus chliarophilus TaxID=52023 RepID=UPI0003FCBBC9|nr:hypothetical protein [Calidithermus chliarophilus]
MSRIYLQLLEPSGGRLHSPNRAQVVSRVGADGRWAFPIGAQSYVEERGARVQLLEVADGVIPDTMGLSSPRFRLEVTFGNRPKNVGGQTVSAMELANDLKRFVGYYFKRRLEQAKARQPLIEMSFHDTYHNRHWIVVPAEEPTLRSTANEPTRSRLSFSLIAVRPFDRPQLAPDRVRAALEPASQTEIGQAVVRYCPVEGARA